MSTAENMIRLLEHTAVEVQRSNWMLEMFYIQRSERELAFEFIREDEHVSKFSVSFLPGCRSVMVFHGVVITPKFRNLGYGKILHKFRLALAKAMKCTTVVCTVVVGNSPERRILEEHGWVMERKVSTNVEMWVKEL